MPLPIRFDENEIFIIIIGILYSFIFVRLLPKRFTYSTSIILFLFNISIGITVDHILASPPHDFYDVMDSKKFELFDLILYLVIYGPATYTFIYIYDKWFYHKSNIKKFLYLFFISLINTVFEYIAVILNIYEYHGWKVYYSIPVYILVYYTNTYLLRLLKENESKPNAHLGNVD
ncbi:putative neutral ceramidase superfamily lipid hydrolase [Bacillus sp. SLBN-46]|nr:putative neutral ceramidase superfamily lipid hydrolase [Bacillus sp. SLBN-46]